MQQEIKTRTRPSRIDRHAASQTSLAWVGIVFVILWASGFVVPRAFHAYAEPMTFVAYRNGGAAIVLIAVAACMRDRWPKDTATVGGLLWAGALLQGFALIGMYSAVYWGIPVGIAALVGGLQPSLTALFAMRLTGERPSLGQWCGIGLGFAGLAISVAPKLENAQVSITLTLLALAGVASMAYSSIYQKRFENAGGAWSRTALLFIGATIPSVIGAVLAEHGTIRWEPALIAIYVWSVLALAIGATMALLFLLRRGEASRAASLIYLVPPTSALMAYFGFGETVDIWQVLGFVVAGSGVALVQFAQAKK